MARFLLLSLMFSCTARPSEYKRAIGERYYCDDPKMMEFMRECTNPKVPLKNNEWHLLVEQCEKTSMKFFCKIQTVLCYSKDKTCDSHDSYGHKKVEIIDLKNMGLPYE